MWLESLQEHRVTDSCSNFSIPLNRKVVVRTIEHSNSIEKIVFCLECGEQRNNRIVNIHEASLVMECFLRLFVLGVTFLEYNKECEGGLNDGVDSGQDPCLAFVNCLLGCKTNGPIVAKLVLVLVFVIKIFIEYYIVKCNVSRVNANTWTHK